MLNEPTRFTWITMLNASSGIGPLRLTMRPGVPTPAHEATCFAIPPDGALNSLGQTTQEALGACQARCSVARLAYRSTVTHNPLRFGPGDWLKAWCTALNIVPLTPPPEAAFPDDQNIPWGVNDCTKDCFAGEPEGSSICYGLRETSRRTVEAPWTIILDDTRDEIFYSTCFRKAPPKKFDGPRCEEDCVAQPSPTPWRYGDACLSCDAVTAFEAADAAVEPGRLPALRPRRRLVIRAADAIVLHRVERRRVRRVDGERDAALQVGRQLDVRPVEPGVPALEDVPRVAGALQVAHLDPRRLRCDRLAPLEGAHLVEVPAEARRHA